MRTFIFRSAVMIGLLIAGVASPALAQSCADAQKSHQFDFWIGEWEVFANGKKAGENRIEAILDGCVLQENWVGAGGGKGSSFNFYNPATKKWHQFWVWRNGTTIETAGEFSDGKMVLSGDGVGRGGKPLKNRISFHDNEDGTVRQHWEQSIDGGKTWTAAFDGLYKKKKK